MGMFLDMLKKTHVLLTFDKVHDPFRLPRKTTSERQKMLCSVIFYSLNLDRCFAPQRRAQFNISTSKSAPELRCFAHFGLEMCFALQQRALFRHLNFLVCSVHFDLDMCFAREQRAIFYFSSGQLAPHPPLCRAYLSTHQSNKSLGKKVLPISFLF